MTSSNAAVVCEDLTVRYGDVIAVDAVSFEVQGGEVFGLLGPNGAGKTSVIRALTTIIEPSGGRAEVAGVPLTSPDRLRREIGVLPESNGYPASESALAYLRFYGQLFGLTAGEAEERGRLLLDQFGLASNAASPISTFSRGMRQRLGIARALINRPRVLFLDEPTLGLDPAGREVVLALLGSVVGENGACVVLCSHLLDDVERVCDRVAILNRGRVVVAGTVAQVSAASVPGGQAEILVADGDAGLAIQALRSIGVTATNADEHRAGELLVELSSPGGSLNRALAALIDAGIEVRGARALGARLSDAFLHLTGKAEA